jgi:two-component system, OmpR family, response regulator
MSEQKQLLIIDDDPDFVDGIKSILVKKGNYKVDTAHNPKDGWAALEKTKYDLLLLDVMMGRGAEGIMIARKLGKDAKFRELPVLIITSIREQMAFLFPGGAVHPNFVDVDELVEKPVDPRLLLDKVSSLIASSEAKKKKK